MGDKIIMHWQIPPTSFPLTDVRRSLPDIRPALNLGAVDHEHYADNCVEIDMIKGYAGRWCVQSPLAQSSAADKATLCLWSQFGDILTERLRLMKMLQVERLSLGRPSLRSEQMV